MLNTKYQLSSSSGFRSCFPYIKVSKGAGYQQMTLDGKELS